MGETLRGSLFERVILTPMRSRRLKEGDVSATPTTREVKRVCLGHARKQHSKERSVVGEKCKARVLQLFNRGITDDGAIDRTKNISPMAAMKLLKKKAIDEEWDKINILTAKQMKSLFSTCKK